MFGTKNISDIKKLTKNEKEEIMNLFSKSNDNYLKNINILSKYLFKLALQSNLESQSFSSLLKECELRNKKFTDREFPPTPSSLINTATNINNTKWKKIIWKRASEYMNEYTIFPKEFTPGEISQGVLNNNIFLSVIAALMEYPSFLKSIYITKEINNYGIYGVNLCKDRKLLPYIIDDFFPCDNKLSIECFSKGAKNTIWLQILEKCYAKSYGSYSKIEFKDIDLVLNDLTCAPITTLDNSLKNLYLKLESAKNKNWIILASAGDTESGQELLKEIGLSPGYVYPVVNVFKIKNDFELPEAVDNLDEKEIEEINSNYLLQIRNHWKKDTWLGDWSMGSMNWTEEMKKMVDYEQNSKNSFYMNLKDFKHYFSKIKICKIFPNNIYNYLTIQQKVDSYSLVKLSITSENKNRCYLTLSQITNKKAFPKGINYGIIRMIICRLISYDENTKEYTIDYISGKMGQEREIYEGIIFEPGDYLVFTELNKNVIDSPIVLSTYSEKKIEINKLNILNFPNILEKIYTSCAKKYGIISRFTKDGANDCIKYSNTTPEGYTYIYIENNEKDITLIESVSYTKFENLKLLEPFKGTSYNVKVEPGQTQIILIKQLELSGYKLVFSYHSNFLFEKDTLLKLTKTQGKKNYRKDPKLNIDLDIVVYVFQYSSGLCFYYENNTQDRKLEETLNLIMIGAEIVGEHEKDDEVKIEINPGEQKFVHLKAVKPNWSVKSNVSYFIREAYT